jgi:hypothetical protein
MQTKRDRALWTTLLFYALVGPLVGLLCLMAISFAVEAWGPMTDRLAALIPHAQSASCDRRYTGHFELRCYQRFEPRQIRYFSEFNFSKLSAVVIVAYIIGFIPAAVAGYFIGAIGMRYGGVRLSHAALIGTMMGLMTAVTFAIISAPMFRPEDAVVLFLICVSATIVCWLVAGRWWRGTEIADTKPTG